MLGPWAWEQGPDVRTSPIIPCVWRACEARQGTTSLSRCRQHPKKVQMTGEEPAGTGSISLLWAGACDGRWMHAAQRPRCAWRATMLLRVEVGGWVWRGGWSLGQVRSGLHKELLALSLSGTSAGEGTGQRIGGAGVEWSRAGSRVEGRGGVWLGGDLFACTTV